MRFERKQAVSPIIATLLLIAIAVAAGIIVYVYVNSLSGGLTASGGNQVSEQLQLQAYNFKGISGTSVSSNGVVMYASLENVGSSSITISAIYYDGTALTQWYNSSTPAYDQYFQVPTAGGNCFGVIPSGVLIASYSSATGVPASGTAALCGTETASDVSCATVICLNSGSAAHSDQTLTLPAQSSAELVIGLNSAATSGTSHTIKIVTADGGQSVFTVVAGRTG